MVVGDFILKLKARGLKKMSVYVVSGLHSFLWAMPIKKSYSQHGEDLIIDNLLNHKRKGFYVDVGTHDPKFRNNTKRFYDKGWRGINIEPDYDNYLKIIKDRKKDINLNIGISDKNVVLNFYRFTPDTVSTFSKDNVPVQEKLGFKLRGIERIKTKKLSDVLNKYARNKQIDFISIDTEGFELKILRSNNWAKFKPTIICVETDFYSTKKKVSEAINSIGKYITKLGYKKVYGNQTNDIYLLKLRS